MKSLKDKHILVAGAGSMATPIIAGLLEKGEARLTVVCGLSEGKNEKALLDYLGKRNISTDRLTLTNRSRVNYNALPTPDIFLYGAKPHQIDTIMPNYRGVINPDTKLVSIAAGKPAEAYHRHLDCRPDTVTTMPHLPKKYFTLFGGSEETKQIAESLLSGVGHPIRVDDADENNKFTAIAGSSPAFLAHFIDQFEDDEIKTYAAKRLREMAEGKKIQWHSHRDALVVKPCLKYYHQWIAAAQHFFGKELGTQLVSATMIGTLDEIKESGLSYQDFATTVRSRKGSTNAGLMVMGSPPPNDSYGTAEEMAAQNKLAVRCNARFENPEDSLIPAIIATLHRTRAMADNPDNPLYGIDLETILEEAKQIEVPKETEATSNKRY